jgi:inositol oxygenase
MSMNETKSFQTVDPEKKPEAFRNYQAEARDSVKEFYRLNHINQTLDFVLSKKREYRPGAHKRMGIWEALEALNSLVDDSDPDTDLPQMEHAMQTSEALRSDNQPEWLVLTGLIHDLGKVLCLYGEPQWAIVGDTFPVACEYSDTIVYPEFLRENPDFGNPEYRSRLGIYKEGCGLDEVHFSWGHDEYLYTVVKNYLPQEALYIIRYHSCYPIHREGAYTYLMNEYDRRMMDWVNRFNPYDLYSKSAQKPDVGALTPYYQDLIARFFPSEIEW